MKTLRRILCTFACRFGGLVAALSLLHGAGCKSANDQIVVCGERISIGTPVILWSDPGGYDAYKTTPPLPETGMEGLRFKPGRAWAATDRPLGRRELAGGIDLFVLHYDACGFSRRCFDVLHNQRGLSVHFLLDVDGTLYQTLDLREQAWHGRETNARSIGVEIANIGAYALEGGGKAGDRQMLDALPQTLREWYLPHAGALQLTVPPEFGDPQIRSTGPFRPNRPEFVRGRIHGRAFVQADFTPQQYAALARLAAGLHKLFPRIRLETPRDAAGAVRMNALAPEELAHFSGIIGHYHITAAKLDPGPAFDWEAFLEAARR